MRGGRSGDESEVTTGTERGFGARGSVKSGSAKPRTPNRRLSDGVAVECARIAAAYHAMLSAALTQLLMHYGSRIAALALCRRGDQAVALAALRQEQDDALASLRASIRAQQRQALARARAKRWRRRYRVPVGVPRPFSPARPQRMIRQRHHGAHPR